MASNYPPGVSGCEPSIIGEPTAADIVFDYLLQRRAGASEGVLARALRMSESDVSTALDLLCESGSVVVIRRTRSAVFYGVRKAGA